MTIGSSFNIELPLLSKYKMLDVTLIKGQDSYGPKGFRIDIATKIDTRIF